jgi:hypothetical protein
MGHHRSSLTNKRPIHSAAGGLQFSPCHCRSEKGVDSISEPLKHALQAVCSHEVVNTKQKIIGAYRSSTSTSDVTVGKAQGFAYLHVQSSATPNSQASGPRGLPFRVQVACPGQGCPWLGTISFG